MHTRNAHAMRRAVLGFCAAILACTLSPPVAAQAIDTAQDLARSAREATAAGVPLLVFFSQPGCPYCDLARQNYLGPMNAVPAARKTVRMVEVDITSESPLVDFGGRATTHRAFALAQKVRFVPVVKFLAARACADRAHRARLLSELSRSPHRAGAGAPRRARAIAAAAQVGATSARTALHWRRLTGSRSDTPSSTTSQCASSSSVAPARSKPRTASRATMQLR